ncbi:tripartite tricarboxylate transporter substrate binding protein [Ahrensia kielensis]|uniref:Tripartite tricarboxylate transporter substrate binding protein n=1 Tax=Ahrensia kielensis TaxID=76980 RepID=A0ABU9TAL8_9HYPH
MKNIVKTAVGAVLMASVSTVALAETFPNKPITIVVPYGAGGSTDNFVRALAGPLQKAFDNDVVVKNVSGGGGAVGTMQTLTHEADGYTVTIPNNAFYTLQGMGNVTFETNDFDYIARIVTEPYVLTIATKPEWSDLDSFVVSAREKPVTLGFAGVGSSTHIMTMAISQALGFEPKLIPFDGDAAAVAAALGGHIDGVVLSPSGVASALDKGDLTAIGATGISELMPDVALFSDKGYDINTLQYRGIASPAGLSAEVKDAWVQALKVAVQDADFQTAAHNLGLDVNPAYGTELDEFIEDGSGLIIAITKTVASK